MLNRPPFRLYVFTQPSCPVCKQVPPVLSQFQRKHPEALVMNTSRRELNGFEAKATPTYLFVVDGAEPHAHQGFLSLEEMEEVYSEIFPDDEDDPDVKHTEKDFGKKAVRGSAKHASDEEE
jgi:thiol-disulfide isomerase/thioredoxin